MKTTITASALALAVLAVLDAPRAQSQVQMQMPVQNPLQQGLQMGPVHETQSCEASRQAVIFAYHCLATTPPSLSKTCDPLFARVAAIAKEEQQATLQRAEAGYQAAVKAQQQARLKQNEEQREELSKIGKPSWPQPLCPPNATCREGGPAPKPGVQPWQSLPRGGQQ